MIIYPYKQGSNSVAGLKAELGIKEIKLSGSSYKGNHNKIILNWGSSMLSDEALKSQIINKPDAVAIAANKLRFFNHVKDQVSIPEYTTDQEVAQKWLDEGKTVFGRTTLTGHSGQGIIEFQPNTEIDQYWKDSKIQLFVKYIPKKEEYRVHVMGDEVIDIQRKAVKFDVNKNHVNFKIRTHAGGFVFVRNEVAPHQKVLDESIKAVAACGLDFGAVDVIWNDYYEKAYVLEVNTAPGLGGTTLKNYSERLDKLSKDLTTVMKGKKFSSVVWDEVPAVLEADFHTNIEDEMGEEAMPFDEDTEMYSPPPPMPPINHGSVQNGPYETF